MAKEKAENLKGLLVSQIVLVTDNGPSFISKRFQEHMRLVNIGEDAQRLFRHVRIGYRMQTQLGLLE